MDAILFRESGDEAHAMFIDPPNEIVGYSDIERVPPRLVASM